MKKLLTILLALLMLCACKAQKPEIPEPGIFKNSEGKIGLRDENGEIAAEAKYLSATKHDNFVLLWSRENASGSAVLYSYSGERIGPEYLSVEKPEAGAEEMFSFEAKFIEDGTEKIYLLDEYGKPVIKMAFESYKAYYFYDDPVWNLQSGVSGISEGREYVWNFNDGAFSLEFVIEPKTVEMLDLLYGENCEENLEKAGGAFYAEDKCWGYEKVKAFAENFGNDTEEKLYLGDAITLFRLWEFGYSDEDSRWYASVYTRTVNDNSVEKKAVSEVKVYENRVTFYFEDGSKKIVYEKGRELGLPMNNCSHPEQAHFIDIEIIRYINSEEFRTKYEKAYSEPYMTFDEFTNTLWSEEEKCLMNIYHYIEHYKLAYEDFIAAYGSEERIAEIWGEADIKGYFEK
ncbi:MAG: hypothetical protein IJO22_02475 [Oscillospiraceae bacterium]|nr:hypothetical protein [Oscillospiraceae bacterium]